MTRAGTSRSGGRGRAPDAAPVGAAEAKALFADFRTESALVLAVSGGPDSMALMWLAARWRRALKNGPSLLAVTVDHGLRPESAREARMVGAAAANLGVPHRTLRWRETKPVTGLPAAARAARYRLLGEAARRAGAGHVLTAHTRDDQAETVLMRLSRGSGLAGLAAMARLSPRDGIVVARPLLDIEKSRLAATVRKAKLGFAEDPTNVDLHYARPRWRALMPALAEEGCDARTLARLAGRLARANAALDLMADGAERYLVVRSGERPGWDAAVFAALPEEIRVRLLGRLLSRVGHEGPAELGKVEALARRMGETAQRGRLKETLAGAVVRLDKGRLQVEPAPPRRARRSE